jgi:cytochrome c oxidase subunit 1
LSF